jgi:hypothetical protein
MADEQIIGATVKLDTSEASKNVEDLAKDLKDVKDALTQVDGSVQVDTSAASQSIETLKDNIEGIEGVSVPVDANTAPAIEDIQDLKNDIDGIGGTTVEVNADTAPATESIDTLKADLAGITTTPVELNVDTEQAHDQIDGVKDDLSTIESSSVQVDVQTGKAIENISGIKDELTGISDSSVKVDVDTSEAQQGVGELKKDLEHVSDVPVQVNTEIAEANIKGLKKEVGEIKATVKDAAAPVQVSTSTSKGNVVELKKEITDVKSQLATPAGSVNVDTAGATAQVRDLKKSLRDVKVDLKEAGTAASSAGKDISGATGHFTNIKNQVASLPGPLGQAASGVTGLGNTFKALLANPVGLVILAIVAALALLYKAFTNTFEGGQKMEQVFAGIKASAQALLDNLAKIGSAIVKFLTFDFSGALDDINEVVDAAASAYTAMAKLTEQAQQLKREQLTNDLDAAKRAKDLAILREQASDESIPIAKRKAALKELRDAAEKNAKEDIDLARRTAENKIAMLTLEKDGALKNAEEINKIKIEQIQVETDNANELRRISKQVTATDKQEIAERKEAAQKAAEAAKQRRQELIEFTNKLTKLQQDNELALIKDGYEKELKQLEFKLADEKRANELAFLDKKITKDQQAQLDAAIDTQIQAQKLTLTTKHNEELAKKEADFQKELAQLSNKIKLDGITDQRKQEKLALQISYEEKLQDAITRYKDDAVKFAEIKALIDEEQRLEQQKLDAKFKKEDDKKKFETEIDAQKAIVDARNADFDAKRAAVDAEVLLVKNAFDTKILSEQEYNAKNKELTNARMQIAELETAHKKAQVNEISGILSALGELVGKQTVAGKALGVATALINTYQGASEAIKQKSVLPSPFDVIAKVANVAAVIATGLKTVRAITAVQVPGGGGGSAQAAAPAITAASPIAPVQASTKIDQGSIEGIATNKQSVRAYVVAEDNKAAVEREQRLKAPSVLGG